MKLGSPASGSSDVTHVVARPANVAGRDAVRGCWSSAPSREGPAVVVLER